MRRLFFFSLLLARVALAPSPAVIAIFGDLHGDDQSAEEFFAIVRPLRPTHLLALGDLVSDEIDNAAWLARFLPRLATEAGVPAANTVFLPGNWEQHFGGKQLFDLLRAHGTLVGEDWLAAHSVQLGQTTIFASHGPQYPVLEKFLPFEEFIDDETAKLLRRVRKIPDAAVFAAYGHLHVGGVWIDKTTNKFKVNPGVLAREYRSPTEHRRFAVYRESAHTLEIHDLDAPSRVEWFPMDVDGGDCPSTLEALGKHPVLGQPGFF